MIHFHHDFKSFRNFDFYHMFGLWIIKKIYFFNCIIEKYTFGIF